MLSMLANSIGAFPVIVAALRVCLVVALTNIPIFLLLLLLLLVFFLVFMFLLLLLVLFIADDVGVCLAVVVFV